ncbi:MAG: polysaccharide deacetylase family protein [Limnochordia bacterium]
MTGRFVVSLDFEKFWGMFDVVSVDEYKENLRNVDDVVDRLLELFVKYRVHATWATVGLLLHDGRDDIERYLPKDRDFYDNPSLNPYEYIKGTPLEPYEFYFAPRVIDKIASTPFQEIASHTYSHYYCLAEGQDICNFKEDLDLFRVVSSSRGYGVTTIVFPRNQVNKRYLPLLLEYGITCYRGNEDHIVYQPDGYKHTLLKRIIRFLDRYVNITGHHTYALDQQSEGLLNVRSSRFLAPYDPRFRKWESLRLKRIKDSMTYAAKNKQVFHLWWHPHNFGKHVDENMVFLESLLKHFVYLNETYDMQSRNMAELALECKSPK